MMSPNKIFGIVLLGHILAVIVLFFQPGCSTTQERPLERTGTGGAASMERESGDPDVWSNQERTTTTETARSDTRSEPRRPRPRDDDFDETSFGDEADSILQPVTPAPRTRTPVRDTGDDEPTYTVQSGDTPGAIARRHGISAQELMEANNISDPRRMRIGQELIIPSGGRAPSGDTPSREERSPRTPSGDTESYVVRSGDTLSGIASRKGTTVAELRRLNNLSGDTIRIDQELRIPASGSGATETRRSGESRPERSRAETTSGTTYTVQSGDTPGSIANRFGVETEALMRANNISDPRRMRLGQELVIPGSGERESRSRTERTRQRTPSEEDETEEEEDEEEEPVEPSDRSLPITPLPDDTFGEDDYPEVELVPED